MLLQFLSTSPYEVAHEPSFFRSLGSFPLPSGDVSQNLGRCWVSLPQLVKQESLAAAGST